MTASRPLLTRSDRGRLRFAAAGRGPAFLSDWSRTLFIHLEVDPDALTRYVPFDLDLRDGRAYVSLVAFELERLRPRRGGRLGELLLRPLSNHGFLNVRTYVRRGGETGIFFLREWLANRISCVLGGPLYGLPYRFGKLDYRHDDRKAELVGSVREPSHEGAIAWRATIEPRSRFAPAPADTLDEFLLERYTAFTERRGVERLFRVWHEPWPQTRLPVSLEERSLLRSTGDWIDGARVIGANYSPGVEDVRVGPAERL